MWCRPLLAFVALLGLAAQAAGQDLLRYAGGGELGVRHLTTWRSSHLLGDLREGRFEQWARLPFRGSIVDPRILSYDVAFSPRWSKDFSDVLPEDIRGRQLGWNFGAQFLPGQRFSASVSGSRSGTTSEGGFGSRREIERSLYAVTTRYGSRYLQGLARYWRGTSDNLFESTPGQPPVLWANTRSVLTLSVHNRKLDASLSRMSLDDRIRDRHRVNVTGRLRHTLQWGKGSRLRSSYQRASRQEWSRASWSERLLLRHTENTTSNYGYSQSSSETARGRLFVRDYSGGLTSLLQPWMRTGFRASRHRSEIDGSSETILRASPNVQLTASLPLSARLSAGGAIGYERRDRENFGVRFVDQLNESHEVPATLRFLLDRTRVDVASIVVTSGDETLIYTLDFDYAVVELDGIVEVLVMPAGRIQEGETVLVSYRNATEGLPSGDVITGSYSLGLSVRWISLTHSRSIRDSRGEDGFATLEFGTFDETRTALTVNTETPLGLWRADASRRNRKTSAFDFTVDGLKTSLTSHIGRRVTLFGAFAANRSRSRASRLDTRSANGGLRISLSRSLTLDGRMQWIEWERDGIVENRTAGGTVNMNLRIYGIAARAWFSHFVRTVPSTQETRRLHLELARRF